MRITSTKQDVGIGEEMVDDGPYSQSAFCASRHCRNLLTKPSRRLLQRCIAESNARSNSKKLYSSREWCLRKSVVSIQKREQQGKKSLCPRSIPLFYPPLQSSSSIQECQHSKNEIVRSRRLNAALLVSTLFQQSSRTSRHRSTPYRSRVQLMRPASGVSSILYMSGGLAVHRFDCGCALSVDSVEV